MTLPYERRNAIQRTEEFLLRLCDPKQTPRVPADIRKEARGLLKHYPTSYYMEMAAEQAPEVFGDWQPVGESIKTTQTRNNIWKPF